MSEVLPEKIRSGEAMDRLVIYITEDSYDKFLCPLINAYLQSVEGTQVDIFFVSWAVRALTEDGAKAIRVNGHHADQDQFVREQVAAAGLPADIMDFLRTLKDTGCVNLYACDMAATIYGVTEGNLIDISDGIVGASWFLNEKAAKADHCQYF